jgi:hypothetical protein
MDGQSSACHPLQAHLVLESYLPFRLILYWLRLKLDSSEARFSRAARSRFAEKRRFVSGTASAVP